MQNKDLFKKLEESRTAWKNGMHGGYIDKFLNDLSLQDPEAFVPVNNGYCENDGIYAPAKKDGKMYLEKARSFQKGDTFPDEYEWIRIG